MKENQKDSRSQQEQKGQHSDKSGQNDKTRNKPSQNNPSTEDTKGDQEKAEGTKMLGRETRTPVAGEKSSQSQSGNKGNK